MSDVQILNRNMPDILALTCPAYKFKISNLQYLNMFFKNLLLFTVAMPKSMQSYRSGSFNFYFFILKTKNNESTINRLNYKHRQEETPTVKRGDFDQFRAFFLNYFKKYQAVFNETQES